MTGQTPTENNAKASRPLQNKEVVYEIGDNEKPSVAIIQAVAALTDTPVTDLDSLYKIVDPEHLDGIIENHDDSPDVVVSISFRFNGCIVTVNQNTVHLLNID